MTTRNTLALVLLLAVAVLAIAATNSGIQSIDRKGSHVRIDGNGDIRIEPRTGQGAIVSGKIVATSVNTCLDAGSTDAYACSLVPAITAYTAGQVVWIKAATVNTGAATLNLNAIGAKAIKKNLDVALADGDIKAGAYVGLVYDGTNFQMLSPISNVAGGVLTATASLDFGATAAGACDSLTITVTGAADGDAVAIGVPAALATADTYQSFQGFVSSANTVTVKRCNLTNATTALTNAAAATVRATVIKA
jgi:hypothetical protein